MMSVSAGRFPRLCFEPLQVASYKLPVAVGRGDLLLATCYLFQNRFAFFAPSLRFGYSLYPFSNGRKYNHVTTPAASKNNAPSPNGAVGAACSHSKLPT